MRPVSRSLFNSSKLSKAATILALFGLVVAPQSFQPVSPASANSATISDVGNNCELSVSSATVAIDSSSASVSLVGSRCVVKFLTAGSYSVTMPTDASVDYLVVGGGGGGGSGGGGAGGVVQGSNYSVTSGNAFTVSVGAGGQGGSGGAGARPVNSTSGGSSVFASITALGGGSGGQGNQHAGDGGSGGGSHYDCTSVSCVGAGSPGQGTNGAASTHGGYGGGAGGGGAGGAGGNTVLYHIGGKGGDGVSSSITGTLTYYGGGGGGGINSNDNKYCGLNSPGTSDSNYYCSASPVTTGGGDGGLGGGGKGSSWGFTGGTQGQKANGSAGTPNTGGGGGGTDPEDGYAYAGGSGIVVLSYVSSASFRKITFDSNNGSGTTSQQSVQSGVATQLTTNPYTYDGYVFQGWNTQADGSGTSYVNMDNVTTTSAFTLYAQWLPGINHTVTFNANSGTGTQNNQVAGLPTNLNANKFTRSGYTFKGWNTAANGSGFSYPDLEIYGFTQDATLYAQWNLTATSYTVSFYGNGATSGTTSSQIANSTQALNANGFSRTGYNFLGWDTNNNSNSPAYLDLQNYSFTANLSLYAIWAAQGSYTITFDGNNSTSGSMSNQTATTRTLLRANNFVRTGYTFLNWNTAANGSGVNYLSSYSYNFGRSITLYAVWGQNFTVSYYGNSNTSGSAPDSQSSYVGGSAIKLANNSGNLARTGYTLSGWNTAANGTGTMYSLGQTNVKLSAGATLYAQWVSATYGVIYSANSSTTGTVPASQSYTYGASGITLRTNSGTLARTGYTFGGWNTAANGTGTSFDAGATGATFSQDTVLYAKWTPKQTEVTYTYNGANGGNTTATDTYSTGATGLVLPTPTKTGYTFAGWYSENAFTNLIGLGGASYSPSTNNATTTVYAKWSADSHAVILNTTGGNAVSNVSFVTAGSVALPYDPTRAGYSFLGWSDTDGGDAVSFPYTPGVIADVTLYALWSANTNTVTFDSNNGSGVSSSTFTTGGSLDAPAAPSRDGYTFVGWSDTDGGDAIEFPYFPSATADITLYTLWSADTHTVTFNSTNGSTVVDSSFVTDGSLAAPAAPSRDGYTFVGWSDTDAGDALGFPYAPGVITDITLYALWAKQVYTVDYDFDGGDSSGASDSVDYVWGDSALKLPTLTRLHFHFDGWFDDSEGGAFVGLSGADFVPTTDTVLYAYWTQNTLSGIGSGTNIGNGTVSDGSATDVTGSVDGSTVHAEIPDGALPDGTTVDIYLPEDSSKADLLLPDPTDVRVDVVVSWLGPDGEVPSAGAGTPVTVTITDPSIKAGDGIFQIVDGVATLIGRATQDGSADVTVTDASQIVVAATPPSEPQEATVTAGNGSAVVSWGAPVTAGGEEIVQYVVTSSTGEICITTGFTCTFTGLPNGKPVTFTISAVNKVGKGVAGPRTKTVTPVDPNADVAPPEDDGDTPPKEIDGSGKFVSTNDQTVLLSWDKKKGKLFARTKGTYIGHIQATITFVKDGKTFVCTAAFGTIKPIPAKTAAEKKKAALGMKVFTGTQFCIDKYKLDPKTTSPKGGLTKPNFAKIKRMKKTASELSKEKLALAALKGFSGTVQLQVIRYLAWPTTMVNRTGFQGNGNKIPVNIRNTKVSLN